LLNSTALAHYEDILGCTYEAINHGLVKGRGWVGWRRELHRLPTEIARRRRVILDASLREFGSSVVQFRSAIGSGTAWQATQNQTNRREYLITVGFVLNEVRNAQWRQNATCPRVDEGRDVAARTVAGVARAEAPRVVEAEVMPRRQVPVAAVERRRGRCHIRRIVGHGVLFV
jgi:hypothetical protein